jgi:hypothetical protein
VKYSLDAAIVTKRALAGAAAGTIATVGPVVFGLVLLLRTGASMDPTLVWGVCIALGVLAAVRSLIAFQRMRSELSGLAIDAGEETLEVKTRRRTHSLPRSAIESIVEVPGWLGGLRVILVERWDGTRDAAEYLDIPRGGEGFGELRAALEKWKTVELPKRRGRFARIAIGIAIVLGLFFVPFLVADVGQSPILAAAMVLAGFVAMRIALSRR